MRRTWIAALPLLCGLAAGGAPEDLEYAKRLGQRGLTEMAQKLLTQLASSGDEATSRAGRYGLALLTKQQAARARILFEYAMGEDQEPKFSREQVLGLYQQAIPDLQSFAEKNPKDAQARFDLAELLQELAEFLTGANYPEERLEERKKLIEENRAQAEKLFARAIEEYDAVYAADSAAVKKQENFDLSDPSYVRMSRAEFGRAIAYYRQALIHPSGSILKSNLLQTASLKLDELQAVHFNDLFGLHALVFLGLCSYELGVDKGDSSQLDTALNYFESLFNEPSLRDDPALPDVGELIAHAFYRYTRACNAAASGEGKLKAKPAYYDKTIAAGVRLDGKLTHSGKSVFALRTRVEVARAYAAQGQYARAIQVAGSVLEVAVLDRQAKLAAETTNTLSAWLAQAGGSAADPQLFFSIGEALSKQRRFSEAVAAYAKAATASRIPEQKEKIGYLAWTKMAAVYRADGRHWAAVLAALPVVEAFLNSGADDQSAFGQYSQDACFTAVNSLRQIAEATKVPSDVAEYERVLQVFRDSFPGHPANSDTQYTIAIGELQKKNYREAAKLFRELPASSKNYWNAQRLIPQILRILAREEKDATKASALFEELLASALDLTKTAQAAGDQPGAKAALQYGRLYEAVALADLARWPEALAKIDAYLTAFSEDYKLQGYELDIKARAHLAAGELEKAEAALGRMKRLLERGIDMPYLAQLNYDIYEKLKAAYEAMEPGKERAEVAARAAALYEEVIKVVKEPQPGHFYNLGLVYAEALRYQEAGDAFQSAAEVEKDAARASGYKLKAAEMKYLAAQPLKEADRAKYLEVLGETRSLFTDVLIPDAADKQAAVLRALGDWQTYPGNAAFDAIKKFPDVILTAAMVYSEANPPDTDGRWVAVRLIDYLHKFTKPIAQLPSDEKWIRTWWDGAELRIRVYLAIGESGTSEMERKAKANAATAAAKLILQYREMDGPERVKRIQELEARAKK
ncbi:MAG: hypothetical protein ACT4PV_00715 [Planctomycetaceae bacterium]